MNQAVIPYTQQYQQQPYPPMTVVGATPFVATQPTTVVPTTFVPPTVIVPASDYYNGQTPMMVQLPLDYSLGYGGAYDGLRGSRGPRLYRKPRSRFSRAMSTLLFGSQAERLRAMELYPEIGSPYGSMYAGYQRGIYDNGFDNLAYQGPCGLMHRRGVICRNCEYYDPYYQA
jgi:hypothetical protein